MTTTSGEPKRLRKGGGGYRLMSYRPRVKKLAPLFVLVTAAACAGGDGPNVEADLEKRGFEIVSCDEVGDGRFICQLEGRRRVQAFVHEGKVLVLKPV
jgi:hypothetical protein